MNEALQYLLEHGGALVRSDMCSVIELADARVHGRMWVTPDGLGIVARLPEWLTMVHESSDAEETRSLLLATVDKFKARTSAQVGPA